MNDSRDNALATLVAWREQGAHTLDPARFCLMEALARRAQQHEGKTRELLDARLSQLLQTYRDKLNTAPAAPAASPRQDACTHALAELRAHLASLAPATEARGAYPELPLLEDMRKIWSRYSARRQLRQSRQTIPDNAGPLNSNQLVHRALALMEQQSPDYLQQFLSYLDALSWLDQLLGEGQLTGKESPKKTAAPKKRTRARSR